MQPAELSPTGQRLLAHLLQAKRESTVTPVDPVHVKGVASGVYFVYEQIRNAADATQRHLLLRSAIERYLRRNVYLRDPAATPIAEDLIIELTQARYIKNDAIAKKTVREIDRLVGQYITFFQQLAASHTVPVSRATTWVYQVMSVLIERLVDPQPLAEGMLDTAYHHYLDAVDRKPFAGIDDKTFALAMHCAACRSIARADIATARTQWILAHPRQSFAKLCQGIDTYFDHPFTNKLVRLFNRNSTPLHSIAAVFRQPGVEADLLDDKPAFMARLEAVVTGQYEVLRHSTIHSLWRMVVFVFITKMIIGIAIEIPYDLIALGHIAIAPLLINLFFPPLYMMSAAIDIKPPRPGNTQAITALVDRILYANQKPLVYKLHRNTTNTTLRFWFNIAYALTFLLPFVLVVWGLATLGFTILHGVIFFVFLSGVSFFRFRLLQSVHEMDVVDRPQTLASTIGDFFHLPFVRLGIWLSDRYQRLNVITFFLDMAIELPLKTSLRILRQWTGFINDKRDEL